MNEASFFIFGPVIGGEPSYWNLEEGWVFEFEKATPFTGEILTLPLPEWSTCVLAFSPDDEPIAQFDPLPDRGLNIFKKSY